MNTRQADYRAALARMERMSETALERLRADMAAMKTEAAKRETRLTSRQVLVKAGPSPA